MDRGEYALAVRRVLEPPACVLEHDIPSCFAGYPRSSFQMPGSNYLSTMSASSVFGSRVRLSPSAFTRASYPL